MQPLLVLTTLAALCISALALPPNGINPITSRPDGSSNELYYLKTHIMTPNLLHRFASNKDNLYLASYHTGPGMADVVFNSDKTRARPGYLRNDSRFAFPTGGRDWFLGLDNPSAGNMWHPVRYSLVARPTAGLSFNADNQLECKPENVSDPLHQWQGWLVCDGPHGKPQLYWLTPSMGNMVLPNSCDVVNLVKEKTA